MQQQGPAKVVARLRANEIGPGFGPGSHILPTSRRAAADVIEEENRRTGEEEGKEKKGSPLGTLRHRLEKLGDFVSLQDIEDGKAGAFSPFSAGSDPGDLELGTIPVSGAQGLLCRPGTVRSLLLLRGQSTRGKTLQGRTRLQG